ncbi:MAG: T9SS type A sorting domain-containing protein [Crocinitomicaceae bacterium]|nr:T9SS type A sorting domain-containing protein [Crocinitomicaceae bacterium]
MKKIYLLVASVFLGASLFGQTFITSHFESALANPSSPQIGLYTWDDGSGGSDGYITGNNNYGDLGAVQLFDATHGVTNTGVINSVGVFVGYKDIVSGTPAITIGVWENNSGAIGNLLGSGTINLADIDTTQAGVTPIIVGTSLKGAYNAIVSFATPIAIPASNSFFAGVLYPTADGEVAIVSSQVGQFPDATTHSGAILSDGTFDNYGQYNVTISLAVFPGVTFDGASVTEVLKAQTRVYPNPANDVVNFEFGTTEVANVTVLNLNGQVVLSSAVNNGALALNVSELESGLYIYQANDANGNVLNTSKFSKK